MALHATATDLALDRRVARGLRALGGALLGAPSAPRVAPRCASEAEEESNQQDAEDPDDDYS